MDGKGVRRYGMDGRRQQQQEETTADINQIMMRFRPIAPKPATVEGVGDGDKKMGGIVVGKKKRRRRRKYVRVSNSSSDGKNQEMVGGHKSGDTDMEEEEVEGKKFVDYLNERTEDGSVEKRIDFELPLMSASMGIEERSWELESSGDVDGGELDRAISEEIRRRRKRRVVVSVSEEGGSTGKEVNQYGLVGSSSTTIDDEVVGITDEEKWRSLEVDTCPGFISDSSNRVQWLNAAFRRMVGEKTKDPSLQDGPIEEAEVEVEVKEGVTVAGYYYSCMVQLEYFWEKSTGRRPGWKRDVVPCDLWKMNCGGFAWRLDIKAALSLGL